MLQGREYAFHPDLPNDPEEIERFLLTTGPTLETRETYYRLLRNLYRWLIQRQRITKRMNPIPRVEMPKLTCKIARSLVPDQLHQLLSHPSHPPQLRAFLHLLADTGLRLSEALSVNESSLGADRVIVTGKTGEREVPVSPATLEMVREALPWPWGHWQSAGLAVRRGFRRAGLYGKRASAHTLRHTFTRLWEGDETLLVGILGWTTPAMLKVYRPYDIRKAVAQHKEFSPVKLAARGAVQLSLLPSYERPRSGSTPT